MRRQRNPPQPSPASFLHRQSEEVKDPKLQRSIDLVLASNDRELATDMSEYLVVRKVLSRGDKTVATERLFQEPAPGSVRGHFYLGTTRYSRHSVFLKKKSFGGLVTLPPKTGPS